MKILLLSILLCAFTNFSFSQEKNHHCIFEFTVLQETANVNKHDDIDRRFKTGYNVRRLTGGIGWNNFFETGVYADFYSGKNEIFIPEDFLYFNRGNIQVFGVYTFPSFVDFKGFKGGIYFRGNYNFPKAKRLTIFLQSNIGVNEVRYRYGNRGKITLKYVRNGEEISHEETDFNIPFYELEEAAANEVVRSKENANKSFNVVLTPGIQFSINSHVFFVIRYGDLRYQNTKRSATGFFGGRRRTYYRDSRFDRGFNTIQLGLRVEI